MYNCVGVLLIVCEKCPVSEDNVCRLRHWPSVYLYLYTDI